MSTSNAFPCFSRTLALVPPTAALLASQAPAADMYLKIDGIEGEATRETHKDWIDVQSFSWGVSQAIDSSGRPTGRSTPAPLVIVKPIDKSSPKLFLGAVRTERLPTLTLDLVRNSFEGKPSTYYTITLSDVLVSSIQSGGEAGSDQPPIETISLHFLKIEMAYRDDAGTAEEVEYSWKLVE